MAKYFRALIDGTPEAEPGTPVAFMASTAGIKRDGLDVELAGGKFDNYQRNPVFLWAHDRGQPGRPPRPPIGRVELREITAEKMRILVTFDQNDQFARQIEQKYRDGFLNAVSIAWDPRSVKSTGRKITEWELVDISGVPVPGDPDALMERQIETLRGWHDEIGAMLEGGQQLTAREAHPPHSTPKAPEDTPWDGPREVAAAEGEAQLWRMHAWRDGELDPETKRAYKLPHHLHTGEVVWRGVAAAMARLPQTDIPDDDRRGVYNHLERHYNQFDKTAPEFRTASEIAALTPELVRGLFLSGEPDMFPNLFAETPAPGPSADAVRASQIEALERISEQITGAQQEQEEQNQVSALAQIARALQ